jgi:hypothetical protein
MTHLTAEQIARRAEDYTGNAAVAVMNRLFRRQDESHLYPICGCFNVTERAIRRIRDARRDGLVIDDGLEYALALDAEISRIVNGPY